MPSLLRARGYYTAGVGKWHLGLRWAARPGSTPDRTTNSGDAPVDWIDYTKAIEDGPTHHGFAEYFGVPASLDIWSLPRSAPPRRSSRALVDASLSP